MDNKLPSYEDILKCLLLNKKKLKNESGKDPSVKEIIRSVVARVQCIYGNASIPSVGKDRCNKLIFDYHSKYINLIINNKSLNSSQEYQDKIKKFKEHAKILFDFSACKCNSFENCSCPKIKKVPILEQHFLTDQRNARNMIIGGVDIENTKILQQREIRKNNLQKSVCNDVNDVGSETESLTSLTSISSCDEDFMPPKTSLARITPDEKKVKKRVLQKTKSLPRFTETCDRYGVSVRAAAMLGTSLQEDIEIVTKDNREEVIDPSKVFREKQTTRMNQTFDIPLTETIYFDGKRDTTLKIEKIGSNRIKEK